MRKILLLVLVILAIVLGYSLVKGGLSKKDQPSTQSKTPILKFALVADSENENGLLAKALNQAKSEGASFVIGLGDWSSVGTIDELTAAKKVFDQLGLVYYLTAGDHDLWESRNKQSLRSSSAERDAGLGGEDSKQNFTQVFGKPSQVFDRQNVRFVILDNSDIYKGIDDFGWQDLESSLGHSLGRDQKSMGDLHGTQLSQNSVIASSRAPSLDTRLTFVFAHKTPFHPQSSHVMGENSAIVADQAKKLMKLLEEKKVDGFFCGDLHFFAQFNSPANIVKMTTIGAIASQKNFQGPRFAMVTVYSDWSWEVQDEEIR